VVSDRQRRILYLVHELPWPADAGHKLRFGQVLMALSRAHDVECWGYTERDPVEVVEGLRRAFPRAGRFVAVRKSVRIRRRPLDVARVLAAAMLQGQPYSMVKFSNASLQRQLAKQLASFDTVVSAFPMLGNLPASLPIPLVLDSHNIEHKLWDRPRGTSFLTAPFVRRESSLLKRAEMKAWREVSAIIAICDEDARIMEESSGARATVLPVTLEAPKPFERAATADVGLIGVWSWAPNERAIAWFGSTIAPLLAAAGLTSRVAGPGLSSQLRGALERAGVEVLGYVKEVETFYAGVRAVAAPYVEGGGVRLKVVEAIMHGAPVVGTDLAFRGLRGLGDDVVTRAATAEEFAQRLAEMIAAPAIALRRAEAAKARLLLEHGPSVGQRALDEVFAQLDKGKGPIDSPVTRTSHP